MRLAEMASPYRGFAAPRTMRSLRSGSNIRTPYVNNWNLDIQRAITNNLSIDVGYVGNHGTKLLGKLDVNQPAREAGGQT